MKQHSVTHARDYRIMNEVDDRRERMLRAESTGRHEPSSMYDGLYDIDEVDDGGRLVERRERSAKDAFIPVADLPSGSQRRPVTPIRKTRAAKPAERPAPSRNSPAVLRRRGSTVEVLL